MKLLIAMTLGSLILSFSVSAQTSRTQLEIIKTTSDLGRCDTYLHTIRSHRMEQGPFFNQACVEMRLKTLDSLLALNGDSDLEAKFEVRKNNFNKCQLTVRQGNSVAKLPYDVSCFKKHVDLVLNDFIDHFSADL
jgi:hypothetical protein